MIIMSVDRGKARTGIAYSDKSESFAFPKQVITEYNEDRLVQKVADKARELGAELIVGGLPKNMDGSESFRAEKTYAFAEMLKNELEMEIIFVDERLSTVQAYTYLNITDFNGKKRKKVIDALSAQIILQSFLDKIRK